MMTNDKYATVLLLTIAVVSSLTPADEHAATRAAQQPLQN
jgi:hypothetical protein